MSLSRGLNAKSDRMAKNDRFDELKKERLERTGSAPANMTVNINIKTKEEEVRGWRKKRRRKMRR